MSFLMPILKRLSSTLPNHHEPDISSTVKSVACGGREIGLLEATDFELDPKVKIYAPVRNQKVCDHTNIPTLVGPHMISTDPTILKWRKKKNPKSAVKRQSCHDVVEGPRGHDWLRHAW